MFLSPVAITIDNNYIQHACVMLKSLEANVKAPVDVYCVYDNISPQNIRIMRNAFKKSSITLHFLPFDSGLLPQLPIKSTDHVTTATFFRIWLPHLLPNLKQVLFMDTDVIINADISSILDLDISGYPLAAIPELNTPAKKKQALGIPDSKLYINGGVLLLNLQYFRQEGLTQKMTDFIIGHPELCEFWDQDAINATIKGNFYRLHYKYNVQSSFYEKVYDEPAVANALKNPVIMHFTGGGTCKPWYYKNTHPERGLYYKYLRLTPFRFYYPPDIPRSWRIFRVLKFIFSNL